MPKSEFEDKEKMDKRRWRGGEEKQTAVLAKDGSKFETRDCFRELNDAIKESPIESTGGELDRLAEEIGTFGVIDVEIDPKVVVLKTCHVLGLLFSIALALLFLF